MPPDHDAVFGKPFVAHHKSFEFHGFSDICIHIFRKIAVKQRVISVRDLDHGRVHIIRHGIYRIVVLRFSVGVFVYDIRLPRNRAHRLMIFVFRRIGRKAVKHHHLRVLDLIERKLAHVCVIGKKRLRIEKRHHLRKEPAFGHRVE